MQNIASIFSSVQKSFQTFASNVQNFGWRNPSAYKVAALAVLETLGAPILWLANRLDPKRFTSQINPAVAAGVTAAYVTIAAGSVLFAFRKQIASVFAKPQTPEQKADSALKKAQGLLDAAKVDDLTKTIADAKAVVAKAEAVLAGGNKDATAAVEAAQAQIEQANGELTNAQTLVSGKDEAVAKATKELTDAQAAHESATKALADVDAQIKGAPAVIQAQNKIIADAQAKVEAAKPLKLAALKATLEVKTLALPALKTAAEAKLEDKATADQTKALEGAKAAFAKAEKEIEELNAEISALTPAAPAVPAAK